MFGPSLVFGWSNLEPTRAEVERVERDTKGPPLGQTVRLFSGPVAVAFGRAASMIWG